MLTVIVPIDYGLPIIVPDTAFDLLEARLFPHTKKHVFGDSCFSPDGIVKAQIYVFPECEKAKFQWLDQMAHRTIEENPGVFIKDPTNTSTVQ